MKKLFIHNGFYTLINNKCKVFLELYFMKRHTASLVKVKVVKTLGKTIARSSENYSKPG